MRRDDRMKVIKNRRKLKGSSIVVIDDICCYTKESTAIQE